MKIVFKYKLDNDIIFMPVGAKILHIGLQQGELYAWALVDKDTSQTATLRVVGTGHPITDNTILGEFIGTFLQYKDTLVLHVFKIEEPTPVDIAKMELDSAAYTHFFSSIEGRVDDLLGGFPEHNTKNEHAAVVNSIMLIVKDEFNRLTDES